MILVLAGTYQQARSYARDCGLDRRDWRFADGMQSIIGHKPGSTLVRIGTWRDRDDAMRVCDEARACGYAVRDPVL